MLFNSYLFIFIFLPITLIPLFVFFKKKSKIFSITWLALASLIFYGYWNIKYLPLMLLSIIANYLIGQQLLKNKIEKQRALLLSFGVILNLTLLFYYKYFSFLVENINFVFDSHLTVNKLVLPLAISFYTFQQIGYLVDIYREEVEKQNFFEYSLFVAFYPQLIAGPIVRQDEILPQFKEKKLFLFDSEKFNLGIAYFVIGLFKKVVIADNISFAANRIFSNALHGPIGFFESWIGALSYSLQLYFDFSGYSEMAMGLAFMVGISLPINFNSPFKAKNIMEFWRRWHITFGRWVESYLYFPLALWARRKGSSLMLILSVLFTMFLVGLWHGASWTFVLYGLLHGSYITLNFMWIKFSKRITYLNPKGKIYSLFAQLLTTVCVIISFVLFRSQNIHQTKNFLNGMFGQSGFQLTDTLLNRIGIFGDWLQQMGVELTDQKYYSDSAYIGIPLLFIFCFFFPNVHEFNKKYTNDWRWAAILGLLGAFSILSLFTPTEFLYFQF